MPTTTYHVSATASKKERSLARLAPDWRAFWTGHSIMQLALLDLAMWVFVFVCAFGPHHHSGGFLPWPLWPLFMLLVCIAQLSWLVQYASSYSPFMDQYAPLKIVFLGGFVNAAASFVFLVIGVYMNATGHASGHERIVEYALMYPIAQLPIYVNYVFAYWDGR